MALSGYHVPTNINQMLPPLMIMLGNAHWIVGPIVLTNKILNGYSGGSKISPWVSCLGQAHNCTNKWEDQPVVENTQSIQRYKSCTP
jgi:hypothetical protein